MSARPRDPHAWRYVAGTALLLVGALLLNLWLWRAFVRWVGCP